MNAICRSLVGPPAMLTEAGSTAGIKEDRIEFLNR